MNIHKNKYYQVESFGSLGYDIHKFRKERIHV